MWLFRFFRFIIGLHPRPSSAPRRRCCKTLDPEGVPGELSPASPAANRFLPALLAVDPSLEEVELVWVCQGVDEC